MQGMSDELNRMKRLWSTNLRVYDTIAQVTSYGKKSAFGSLLLTHL